MTPALRHLGGDDRGPAPHQQEPGRQEGCHAVPGQLSPAPQGAETGPASLPNRGLRVCQPVIPSKRQLLADRLEQKA